MIRIRWIVILVLCLAFSPLYAQAKKAGKAGAKGKTAGKADKKAKKKTKKAKKAGDFTAVIDKLTGEADVQIKGSDDWDTGITSEGYDAPEPSDQSPCHMIFHLQW